MDSADRVDRSDGVVGHDPIDRVTIIGEMSGAIRITGAAHNAVTARPVLIDRQDTCEVHERGSVASAREWGDAVVGEDGSRLFQRRVAFDTQRC